MVVREERLAVQREEVIQPLPRRTGGRGPHDPPPVSRASFRAACKANIRIHALAPGAPACRAPSAISACSADETRTWMTTSLRLCFGSFGRPRPTMSLVYVRTKKAQGPLSLGENDLDRNQNVVPGRTHPSFRPRKNTPPCRPESLDPFEARSYNTT